MKIKLKSMTFNILKVFAAAAAETKDILAGYGPSFNAFMTRKSLDEVLTAMPGYKNNPAGYKWNYYTSLGRLKKKGFIKFMDDDHFVITDKGKGVLVKFDIDAITLPDFDPKNWDGIWRVLIFDIPELTRAVRNLFRAKIQELGFYTLQKSVYVTPNNCEKEIAWLTRFLGIKNGVDIILASKLGYKEYAVKKFFGIR